MAEDNPRNNGARPRGRPFAPGNPGRPPGSRHATTLMAEKLMSDDVSGIVTSIINAAKNGDMQAARIIMDRVVPVRKGAAIPFTLPPIATADDVDQAVAAVTDLMAAGELSPEEASIVASVIELRRKAIETNDIFRRLDTLETRIGNGGQR